MEHTFQRENSFELTDGICFHGNDIYECDGFTHSESTLKRIQNTDHQYLCLDGTHLVYQAKARSRTSDDCRFILHTYKSSTSDNGLPVMLQIRLKEKNFTVCCGQQEKNVYAKQDYPVPDTFEDRSHDALFFLKDIIGRCDLKCLESARWPKYYMSFKDSYSVSDVDSGEVDSPGWPTVALLDIKNGVNERTNLMVIDV